MSGEGQIVILAKLCDIEEHIIKGFGIVIELLEKIVGTDEK